MVCSLDAEIKAYAQFHECRFLFLADLVGRLLPNGGSVLDVGVSLQTQKLLEHCPGLRIDGLGLEDGRFVGLVRQHWHYDLDACTDEASWPSLPATYNLVLIAEVIEHLGVPPHRVLLGLKRYLKPGGYLIVQTPNAVSTWKRLKILVGKNPYEPLRTPKGAGHLREYSLDELLAAGRQAGLEVAESYVENYFGQRPPLRRAVYNLLCALMPRPARDGITVVFRQP